MRKPLGVTKRSGAGWPSLAETYPPVTFSPAGRSPATGATVEVRDGEEHSGFDITMEKEPVYCVAFRPDSAELGPVPDLRVNLLATEWIGARGPVVANEQVPAGQDSYLCGLPSGEYRFNFLAMIRLAGNQPRGLGFAHTSVTIDRRHVELTAPPIAPLTQLSGRVSVRNAQPGAPAPGGMRVVLALRNRGMHPNDVLLAHVGADGSFALRGVYPDSYGLRLENLPEGHYVVHADQNGVDLRVHDVRTGAGDIGIEIDPAGPVLSGRVLAGDREPAPLPEATVFLMSRNGGGVYIAQADQSGTYSFMSGIPPGDYRVAAAADLAEPLRRDPRAAAQYRSSAIEVTLPEGARKSIDLKLSR